MEDLHGRVPYRYWLQRCEVGKNTAMATARAIAMAMAMAAVIKPDQSEGGKR